jgi:hypothetical protein
MWNDRPDRHTRYETREANGSPDRQSRRVDEGYDFSKFRAGRGRVSWRFAVRMVK